MENLKIRVNNEAESKEAQELFFELGYEWKYRNIGKNYHSDSSIGFLYADNWCITTGNKDNGYDYFKYRTGEYKELTLPQLRDLVVLKRNDVKDANVEDGTGFPLYLSSTNELYVNDCEWKLSNKNGDFDYICKLKLIHRPQDPALISGAEAKLFEQAKRFITSDHLDRFQAAQAHLEGKAVQFMLSNGAFFDITDDSTVGIFATDGGYSFRLKPQTIKVELELPKPFEPKVGEWYFFVSTENECGYSTDKFEGLDRDVDQTQFGAYRTVNEIEQVVEQLRKIKGAV